MSALGFVGGHGMSDLITMDDLSNDEIWRYWIRLKGCCRLQMEMFTLLCCKGRFSATYSLRIQLELGCLSNQR